MYLLLTLLIPLLVLFLLFGHFRKQKNIKRIQNMSTDDKRILLNTLIEPFGYHYLSCQDLFTTRIDAWQREFGYGTLYDKAAVHLNMVFDCLPVYFNYHDRTWLLEVWKGQYGINTGGEMGLYYANKIISSDEYDSTIFQSVEDAHMVKMAFTLFKETESIARLSKLHWWMTAFRPGCFSQPNELSMNATITFPHADMAQAFAEGLKKAVLPAHDIYRNYKSVSFTFANSKNQWGLFHRIRAGLALFSNWFWCKIYLFTTRPFALSLDKILYLYYYIPFAFRRMLHIHKYKRSQKS